MTLPRSAVTNYGQFRPSCCCDALPWQNCGCLDADAMRTQSERTNDSINAEADFRLEAQGFLTGAGNER